MAIEESASLVLRRVRNARAAGGSPWQPTPADCQYWYRYAPWFGSRVVEEIERTLQETWLDSAGGRIHLDVYPAATAPAAGTLVFSHGMAGYGRLLGPFAVRFQQRGFDVICPDLEGYGFNAGLRGDWLWPHFVQNLLDTCRYARERFGDPVFLGGGSLGGPLAYHAACLEPGLSAVACYCLFDFRDNRFLADVSRFGILTAPTRLMLATGRRLFPTLRVPTEWVITYEHVAEDPALVEVLRQDPLAGTRVSTRALDSLLRAAPAIEYERFTTPTIVVQPGADRMTPAYWSRRYFERLNCEKTYVDVPGAGHTVIKPNQLDLMVDSMASWFKQHREVRYPGRTCADRTS